MVLDYLVRKNIIRTRSGQLIAIADVDLRDNDRNGKVEYEYHRHLHKAEVFFDGKSGGYCLATPVDTYSVKGIKTFKGMDTDGYNCTLYKDGKKVAFVIEEGSGGEPMFDFVSREAEADLLAFVKTLPKVKTTIPISKDKTEPFEYDEVMATFVGSLVEQYLEEQSLRKRCKNHLVIRLDDGKIYEYKFPYDPIKARPAIEKHFGTKLVEILNETYAKEVR